MLEFQPESLDKMKARLPAALEFVHDPDLLVTGVQIQPGKRRKHVFDYRDGLRMIISKDRFGGEVYIHLSASVIAQRKLWKEFRKGTMNMEKFIHLLAIRCQNLWSKKIDMKLIAVSEGKQIPHFIIREVEEKP